MDGAGEVLRGHKWYTSGETPKTRRKRAPESGGGERRKVFVPQCSFRSAARRIVRLQRGWRSMIIVSWILGAMVAGSLAYCVLIVVAARRYLSVPRPPEKPLPPISVLKPMCGAEDCMEDNLRSFFEQDYPTFEILFAVH